MTFECYKGGKNSMTALKVLVCVDGSEEAKKAAQLSGRFAKLTRSDLMLVHVLEDLVSYEEVPNAPLYQERKKEGEEILKEARKIVESEGASCITRLIVGPVASEIVRLAEKEDCDAICAGTRGKTGIKRMLLGSVADRIIRYAHCPVTVIR
jgi:nucleotide-binding universal stress UspA family protein